MLKTMWKELWWFRIILWFEAGPQLVTKRIVVHSAKPLEMEDWVVWKGPQEGLRLIAEFIPRRNKLWERRYSVTREDAQLGDQLGGSTLLWDRRWGLRGSDLFVLIFLVFMGHPNVYSGTASLLIISIGLLLGFPSYVDICIQNCVCTMQRQSQPTPSQQSIFSKLLLYRNSGASIVKEKGPLSSCLYGSGGQQQDWGRK